MSSPEPLRYAALDVHFDDGVDGRVESVTAEKVTVVGAWSTEAELILRPDSPVVVLTRAEYERLTENLAWDDEEAMA